MVRLKGLAGMALWVGVAVGVGMGGGIRFGARAFCMKPFRVGSSELLLGRYGFLSVAGVGDFLGDVLDEVDDVER